MAQPPSERRSHSPANDHPVQANGAGTNGARASEFAAPAIASEASGDNGSSNGLGNRSKDDSTAWQGSEAEFDPAFDTEFEPELAAKTLAVEPHEPDPDVQPFSTTSSRSLPHPPFWHRLETKAAAIALLCGLLSGALVGGGVYIATSRLLAQQAKQIQTQQTQQLAVSAGAWLRDRSQELNQIANSTTLTSTGFWNQPLVNKQQVLNRLRSQYSTYARLTVFDDQGRQVVQAPGEAEPASVNATVPNAASPPATDAAAPPNLGTADAANAPAAPVNQAIQQVLTSQQTTLTPSAAPGIAFDIAAPVRINGQLVGVLQAQLADDTVWSALTPTATEPNQSYLVQTDGTLLSQSNPTASPSSQVPEMVVTAWPRLTQTNSTLIQQDEYWISATPVTQPVAELGANSGLSAVWVQPEFGTHRLPSSVAYTIGLGALLAGLGSGILGAWAASHTTRSLRRATQAIQDLERDRTSFNLTTTGRDELAVLGQSVQSLAHHIDQARQTQVLELAQLQDDVDEARQQAEAIRDRIQQLQHEHQAQIDQLQANTQQQQATWRQAMDQLRAEHAQQIDDVRADYMQQIERLQQDARSGRQQQEAIVQQLEAQRRFQFEELRTAMQAVNQGNLDQPLPELAGELQEMAQVYSRTVRQLHQAKQQQARSHQRLTEIIAQLDREIQSLHAIEQSFNPLALWPTAEQSLRGVSTTLHNLTHNMQQLQELAQSAKTALADTSAAQPLAYLHTLHQSSSDLQQQLEQIQPEVQQMTQTVLDLSQITGQITLLAFNASLNLSRLPDDAAGTRQPLASRLSQLRSLSQQSVQKTYSLTQQMTRFQQTMTQVSPQAGQIAAQVLGNVNSLNQQQQQLSHLAKLQQALLPQIEQTQQTLIEQPQPILDTLHTMQDTPTFIEQTRRQLTQITTTLQTILTTTQDLTTEPFETDLETDSNATSPPNPN